MNYIGFGRRSCHPQEIVRDDITDAEETRSLSHFLSANTPVCRAIPLVVLNFRKFVDLSAHSCL